MNKTEDILESKSVRPTAMRVLIYRFLEKQKTAVSLTDIEVAFQSADRTTLYRNLKTFEKKGMVHKIDDGTGVAKYALCETGCNCDIGDDLHLHFHCTNCNETQCFINQKIPQINLPAGFKATDANLVVKGICSNCNI